MEKVTKDLLAITAVVANNNLAKCGKKIRLHISYENGFSYVRTNNYKAAHVGTNKSCLAFLHGINAVLSED
jgi:hypothetical protein